MFLLPCCWTTYPCSAWLVDGVDFLKHIDSSFSGSAEKQMHVSLLVSWDLGQYLATCMCFGWTVNSTCVLYCIRFDYMHMPWWSAAPIVVTCNKSFDSAWMLKNEDTFIQLQFSSSVFDFFFHFGGKNLVRYLSKYTCMFVTKRTNKKQLVSIENGEATACVFASCFTHVVAAKRSNKLITSALNLKSNYSKHWSATSFKPHARYHIGPSRAIKTAVIEFWTHCGVEIVKWGGKTPLICPNGCYMIVWIPQIH